MRKKSKVNGFVDRLQTEALKQAQLENTRLLPKNIDWLARLIGTHPWQMLLLTSFLTTILIELLTN